VIHPEIGSKKIMRIFGRHALLKKQVAWFLKKEYILYLKFTIWFPAKITYGSDFDIPPPLKSI
jgi:hypothetical protein